MRGAGSVPSSAVRHPGLARLRQLDGRHHERGESETEVCPALAGNHRPGT